MTNKEQSRYKDLLVWQKSLSFADQVFDLIDHLETSRTHYRLIEQLESAVTSVPMNIAEGMRSTLMVKVDHPKKNLCTSCISPEDRSTKH